MYLDLSYRTAPMVSEIGRLKLKRRTLNAVAKGLPLARTEVLKLWPPSVSKDSDRFLATIKSTFLQQYLLSGVRTGPTCSGVSYLKSARDIF